MIGNEERCIHLTIADSVTDSTYYLNKQQIKSIDVPNSETVRINMGEGPLRHITIVASDVSNPQTFNDAKEVRDYLLSIWKRDYTDTTTSTKQDEQTTQLTEMKNLFQDMKTILTANNPASVFNQPLISDSSTAGTTYYGYAVAGTAVNAQGWAIKKVVVSGGTTNYLWSSGSLTLNQIWNNRTSLTYSAISMP